MCTRCCCSTNHRNAQCPQVTAECESITEINSGTPGRSLEPSAGSPNALSSEFGNAGALVAALVIDRSVQIGSREKNQRVEDNTEK